MPNASAGETAIVVGVRVAGLVAAHRLHRRGFLEAESRVGGRTSTLEKDEFRVDLAATTMLGAPTTGPSS